MSSIEDNIPPSSPSADPHSYARQYNLCTNYRDDGNGPLKFIDAESYDVEDDDDEWRNPRDDECKLERMEIENSTLAYLATLQRLEVDNDEFLVPDLLRWRDLRIDHPALSHDHELHIGKIQKRYSDLSCFRVVDQLQQEQCEKSNDSVTSNGCHAADQRSEMLEVSRDTANAIREILKLQHLDLKDICQSLLPLHESFHDYKEDEPILPIFTNIINTTARTSSPLLLSESNKKSEFSDSSMCDLQISQEDLEDIVAEDTFQLLNSSDQVIGDQSIIAQTKFEDLKITSPLLCPSNDENSQVDEKANARHHHNSVLLYSTSSISLPSIDAEISNHLLRIGQAKQDFDHEISQERLVGIDTTLRLPLPELQAIRINEPWRSEGATIEKTDERNCQLRSCRSLLGSCKWRGLSKLERKLSWKPLTLSELSTYDMFEQDIFAKQTIDQFLPADQRSLLDIALSVLPQPSSSMQNPSFAFEHPLSPLQISSAIDRTHNQNMPDRSIMAPQPFTNNMTAALHKRKREIDEDIANKRTHTGRLIDRRTSESNEHRLEDPMAMFLSLQGIDAGKTHGIDHDIQEQTHSILPAAKVIDNPIILSRMTHNLPIPACQIAARPAQIVVTTATMSRRPLIEKMIEEAPHVQMVERITSQARPGHTMIEADISLFPSSGLMLTTLQRIKQKRLPGQDDGKHDIGLRQHIAQVARSYEHMTILVSEGRAENLGSIDFQDLSEADCEVLADLMAWSLSLSTTVDVTYVAGGNTELSHWICGHIIPSLQSVQLMSEESRWERFLRYVGFNAFAAQGILADLDQHSAAENSSSTLLKLMNLSKAENDRLSILLGGKKNLNCLKFDGTWYHKHVKLSTDGLDSGKHQPQWL